LGLNENNLAGVT